MQTISLCMIVKNEEDVLQRCLDSVAELVDEIIIVDTGSIDSTKEIASHYTSKVYHFAWNDDFAAARNYSFSKATMDYCMWVDADDVMEILEKEKFLELKNTLLQSVDIVMMKYNTAFDDMGIPIFSYYRERLIRNSGKHSWVGEVHEVIPPNGSVMYYDIAINHKKIKTSDSDRNLRIYKDLIAKDKKLDPRQQYYYGRELYYHEFYNEAISVFRSFLELKDGWLENKIEACSLCAHCYYKLKEDNLALEILLRSMEYDLPRAELCCDIGKHFFTRGKYNISIYWYKLAQSIDRKDQNGGFVLPDCYNYIPFLQLCVCYDKLGDRKKAEVFNEKAGECKPNSKAYLYNKEYFHTPK